MCGHSDDEKRVTHRPCGECAISKAEADLKAERDKAAASEQVRADLKTAGLLDKVMALEKAAQDRMRYIHDWERTWF